MTFSCDCKIYSKHLYKYHLKFFRSLFNEVLVVGVDFGVRVGVGFGVGVGFMTRYYLNPL